MRKATAELILKDPDRFAHHDRVFLNNPVVMQGMGLAPLVVLATTAHNGVMLAAAVTLLLVPSRVLACLLSRLFPLNSENPAPEEPLLTYRFGRVQETLHKAVSKGLRITVGYALLLMLLGCVREWLALGTVFGTPVGQRAVLPMAGMPAGGFIVLGVLCAVWRALAARRKAYLVREARSLVDVHAQKEADGEQ